MSTQIDWQARLRIMASHSIISLASQLARYTPAARHTRRKVEVLRNFVYLPGSQDKAHRLDIYRPRQGNGPWPLLMYVHGGGFSVCSKESHWMMAERFAAHGYCVANVEYRLAPKHPYPAALEDLVAAMAWLKRHAHDAGGDIERWVLAGESAGANLVTSLAIAMAQPRPEPFTAPLYALGLKPRAVLAACGIFKVSETERFHKTGAHPLVVRRAKDICHHYAPGALALEPLASPLSFVEDPACSAVLPPFLVSVGERDPIAGDSYRLAEALRRLGGQVTLRTYPGEGHAFHAFGERAAVRAFWDDTFAFLDETLKTAAA